jgi:hypothetical protein
VNDLGDLSDGGGVDFRVAVAEVGLQDRSGGVSAGVLFEAGRRPWARWPTYYSDAGGEVELLLAVLEGNPDALALLHD